MEKSEDTHTHTCAQGQIVTTADNCGHLKVQCEKFGFFWLFFSFMIVQKERERGIGPSCDHLMSLFLLRNLQI